MRSNLLDTAGYQPQTVEKVQRLLELLAEFGGHPFLGPRARLHGGTALNVLDLGMPGLSVDADLTYVGQVTKQGFEAERPEMERALTELAQGSDTASQRAARSPTRDARSNCDTATATSEI